MKNDKPSEGGTPSDGGQAGGPGGAPGGNGIPKTADTTNLWMWIGLFAAAVAGICGAGTLIRRRKEER